jgi:hypothetical protein
MTTPPITPRGELYGAAQRLRTGLVVARADLDAPLAYLLEAVASSALENDHEECASWCSPATCDLSAALAVARRINAPDRA